jgi:hypothetical protein
MASIRAVLILLGAISFASSTTAAYSQCVVFEKPEELFARSDAAFAATVLTNEPTGTHGAHQIVSIARLRVETSWKGRVDREVRVGSDKPFEVGKKYVVFAAGIPLSTSILCGAAEPADRAKEKLDWLATNADRQAGRIQAQTPWERYTAQPTSNNASAVTELSYSDKKDDSDELMRVERDLMLLEIQVAASDRAAVDLAFRIRGTLNGVLAENMDQMLGRLIRLNPHLFLQSLQRHRASRQELSGVVGNFGEAYVDRDSARAYERDQRVASLLKVKDPGLLRVRDGCVALLQRH